MAKFKRPGDPAKIVEEQWYTYGPAIVVSETYENGGVRFFLYGMNPGKHPFLNTKGLEEDGVPATKEEAMRHLEEVKMELAKYTDSASRPQ